MDIEKNKPSAPHLDENLKNNHETNSDEMYSIKEIIATNKKIIANNKEVIEQNREFLRK